MKTKSLFAETKAELARQKHDELETLVEALRISVRRAREGGPVWKNMVNAASAAVVELVIELHGVAK